MWRLWVDLDNDRTINNANEIVAVAPMVSGENNFVWAGTDSQVHQYRMDSTTPRSFFRMVKSIFSLQGLNQDKLRRIRRTMTHCHSRGTTRPSLDSPTPLCVCILGHRANA